MLNQFVCVGRITYKEQDDKDNTIITLKIPDKFASEKSIMFAITIPGNISENWPTQSTQYLNINDLVGVKGYIANDNLLIAEKLTFLSTTKNTDTEED